MKNRSGSFQIALRVFISLMILILPALRAQAQAPIGNDAFSFQVYHINPGFYPILQAYIRTFDQNMEPIKNLNLMNIGIQVDGKNYDPVKCFDMQTRRGMYGIDTLQNRDEAFRTVLVLDCSISMAGAPFADAKNAIVKYIQIKRPSDQIAIIAIRDTGDGYQLISSFEKDPTLLYQRVEDVKCDGQKTRIYDSVVAALELCASSSQGGINNSGAEFALLNCIVVVSDGHDEGSSISKDVLVTKLASMKPSVPIFSLAYSNTPERQYFTNLEALSKASFGRYWSVNETQSFATTLQKIHEINRGDYVVTFRATKDPDGNEHNFAIGIQWPSNSGRFIYRTGQFLAMDSPAVLIGGKAKDMYEQLKQTYPVPQQFGLADSTVPPQTQPVPAANQVLPAQTTVVGSAVPNGQSEQQTTKAEAIPSKMTAKDIALIVAVGAAILFMIIAIILWVRSSAIANRSFAAGSPGTSTKPPTH